jgi:hypothetical protein
MEENKRRNIRVPVELHVQIQTGVEQVPGTLLNLSLDGAFIKSAQLIDAQERVTLIFGIPGKKQVQAGGKVMWGGSIEGADRITYGMGVHFDQLTSDDRENITAYIRDLMEN